MSSATFGFAPKICLDSMNANDHDSDSLIMALHFPRLGLLREGIGVRKWSFVNCRMLLQVMSNVIQC